MAPSSLTIDPRFNGPPASGNGGYVCGRLASCVSSGGAVVVTLRRPPPLAVPLDVTSTAQGGALLTHGELLVAEAAPATLDVAPVEPVSPAQAQAAEASYGGLVTHPFPTCFACGPQREPGDGLRLFPGRLGDGRTACTWTPHESVAITGEVAPEIVWAALDCPGGWSADIEGRPMVLGRMTARVQALPKVGERCVVMGRLIGQEGRRTWTASTVYGADGRIHGLAHATWVALPGASAG